MKPTIASTDSPSELHFNEMKQVFFYPTQWKVISYVNLEPTQMLWKQVKLHQLQIVNNCMKIHNATWYPLTECRAYTPYIRSKVWYVDQLEDIIADYLSVKSERVKRGVLELVENILKFLFGTLSQSDAERYTHHIHTLEEEQQSFLRVSQDQVIALKSAIMSFNITIQNVNRNEKILNENLQSLNKMAVDEINQMQIRLNSVLMLNKNIQQIQRGLDECQHTFEILVDAFLHAQN
jgi:hypothetical protein